MLLQMALGRFKGKRTAVGWTAGGRVVVVPFVRRAPGVCLALQKSGSHEGPFLTQAPSDLLLLCYGAKSTELAS